MAEDSATGWIANGTGGFGQVRDQDDFLHAQGNPAGASATETYYFGFSVPEQAVCGFIYLWFHPNLGTVSAGVMVYQGQCPSALAAAYSDIRNHLSIADHVDAASGVMQFPMGLRLEPVVPLQHWRITQAENSRGTAFALDFRAAQPPVVRADQKHFDQAMRVTGSLVLGGRSLAVDCVQVRDRSWNNLRVEDPLPVPPYDWLTLATADGLAINLSLFDDLRVLGPVNGIGVPAQVLQDGWVQRDGQALRVVEVSKRSERDPHTLAPTRHLLRAVDEAGGVWELDGEVVAGSNWNGWPNMIWHQGLLRWTCNGRPAWGESQEVHWQPFVSAWHAARLADANRSPARSL